MRERIAAGVDVLMECIDGMDSDTAETIAERMYDVMKPEASEDRKTFNIAPGLARRLKRG